MILAGSISLSSDRGVSLCNIRNCHSKFDLDTFDRFSSNANIDPNAIRLSNGTGQARSVSLHCALHFFITLHGGRKSGGGGCHLASGS